MAAEQALMSKTLALRSFHDEVAYEVMKRNHKIYSDTRCNLKRHQGKGCCFHDIWKRLFKIHISDSVVLDGDGHT